MYVSEDRFRLSVEEGGKTGTTGGITQRQYGVPE